MNDISQPTIKIEQTAFQQSMYIRDVECHFYFFGNLQQQKRTETQK